MQSGAPLQICILARKNLSWVTRVARQAQALTDAGHAVTVVCLTRPCDELIATTPDVEYVELLLDPWTRRVLSDRRRRRLLKRKVRARRERDRRRNPPPVWRRAMRAAFRKLAAAVGRPARYAFVALPCAVLLKLPGERLRDRAREVAALDTIAILRLHLLALAQHANTVSFGKKACEAMGGRRFDCCQAHDNYALVAAHRLARQTGAELLYDAVEIPEHRQGLVLQSRSVLMRLSAQYERRVEAGIIRSARAVIAVGEGQAEWYAKRYRIPCPVPVRNCRYFWPYSRRDEIRRDCGLGVDDKLVVWFGHAYPAQGLEAIVTAARYVNPRTHFALLAVIQPAWESFVGGLVDRVDELGLRSRVHFLEQRAPNDLISYVSGADAGIIPLHDLSLNITYCMPNKFMEMVMARLPLATSDLVEMRGLVERYGMGETFDVEDPLDIAQKLERMLEPDNQARMRAGVMRAAEDLSWERELRAYVTLFEPLAAERDAGMRRAAAAVAA